MPLRILSTALILVALCACGKAEHPEEPTLVLDRDAMRFGLDFEQAVYVGTSKQESLLVENKGLKPLIITEVAKVAGPEFTLVLPEDFAAGNFTVEPLGHTFLQVYFEPTEAKSYIGALTIRSNAANAPEKTVELAGQGVTPP